MYKLRTYQTEAVKAMKETKVGDPSLIVLPTGAGKTVCFAKLVSGIKQSRVLIIVPSSELREQAITKIKNLDPNISVGSAQGQKYNQLDARIVIGTWQSFSHKKSKRIKTMLEYGGFSYVVVDEAHIAVDKIERIISQLGNNVKIVGMTATPYNPKLYNIFKKITYNKSILEMITDGYLCDPLCIRIQTDTDLNGVGISKGDFKEHELQKAVNNLKRNRLIVKSYLEYASDRKSTLVFASGIQHINDLVKQFTDAGVYCKGLDSNHTPEYRKQLLEEFTSGKLPVLINCGILTTGFDFEALECVILARPTKSKILYVQCLGRGLRTYPDKENALILDIADLIRTHDIQDVNSVFEMKIKQGETLKEAKERTDEEKRLAEEKAAEELAKQLALQQRAELLRQQQEEIRLNAERIDLFNVSFAKTLADSEYDWFKIDSVTYGLTYTMMNHYVLEHKDNAYTLYDAFTSKETKEIKIIKTTDDIRWIMKFLDSHLVFNPSRHLFQHAAWKDQDASEKQKEKAPHVKTKWEAHVYFTKYQIGKLIKNFVQVDSTEGKLIS